MTARRLLDEPVDEAKAVPQGTIKGAPVEDSEVLQNIRDSVLFDLPVLEKQQPQERTMVFVAGGPTLLDFMDELKERKSRGDYICTSNNTYDFLVGKGIIPDSCLILDPKEQVKDYVMKPQPESMFYVATVANKAVFEKLLERGARITKVLLAYGAPDDEDLTLQSAFYKRTGKDFLVGGTMTPLRAMPFAVLTGFTKIEFYGFDSCFSTKQPPIVYQGEEGYDELLKGGAVTYADSEDGREFIINEPPEGGFFYAYKKKRVENIQIIMTPDNRRFLTSPGFGNQARQLTKWVDRLEDRLEVVIHGDSLSSHLLKLHRENLVKAKAEVGEERWTDYYRGQQEQMHQTGRYGTQGDVNLELVSRTIVAIYERTMKPVTVLDYGCGAGALGDALNSLFKAIEVKNYDPFHPKWKNDPAPEGEYDLVTCMDVMEHVEAQCVPNTISFIAQHCRYLAIFAIATEDALKTLPDGRNAHITQRQVQWWVKQMLPHFVVLEARHMDGAVILVCQKPNLSTELHGGRPRLKVA